MTTAPTTFSSRVILVARDIKLSHSIFALPFALLATFLAAASRAENQFPRWSTVLLIVVCMFLARTVAMMINRWADAKIDADNPRTAKRAIPSGELSRQFVLVGALVCAAAFVAAAGGFWLINENPWPLMLSPLVLAWLCVYSFMKRYTWLCHLILGSALALSPLAAAVAVEPVYVTVVEPYLLAVMVMCWVAGFDVIYALQDVSVDLEQGLFSMPSRLGENTSLLISRLLHVVSIAALFALWHLSGPLDIAFLVGVIIVTGLIVLEHALVWGSKTNHINMAFFTLNGVISLLLGGLGIFDVVRANGSL